MNKKDLVKAMSEEASANGVNVSQSVAEACLDAYMEVTKKELASGGSVALVGYGTLSTQVRGAREGRNPQTGDTIKIPEKRVVKFKAGSKLDDVVNQ